MKGSRKKERRSIVQEYFLNLSVILLTGMLLMCLIQMGLFTASLMQDRQQELTAVLDGATALSGQLADEGNVVTDPLANEALRERAEAGFELFHTSAGTLIFVVDEAGEVLLSTETPDLTGAPVPRTVLDQLDAGGDYFARGTLSGVYSAKYYTAARRIDFGSTAGYLFVATSTAGLSAYQMNMWSIFLFAAAVVLVFSSLFSVVFSRRITKPIEQVGMAARQLGSGDFTARAPVTGCEELADFATTFNNMAARLQTIDNARGQFMGNIAHELRTPMTSIQGFIDGMLDGTIPPEEYRHYLGIVSQETGRLARLVKNMLDITKLEAGEVKINARLYNVWDTLTDVVLSDEQRIEDGKIDIQGLQTDRLTVYADPDFVHQVVYNIVDNAIKFTPPGGVITFSARRDGGMVVVAIENTGEGISPAALPFVFERFYKEDRSRGMNTHGSGLGLHICKVLINLSGGQIKAESKEGEWCRFTFTLPAEAGK